MELSITDNFESVMLEIWTIHQSLKSLLRQRYTNLIYLVPSRHSVACTLPSSASHSHQRKAGSNLTSRIISMIRPPILLFKRINTTPQRHSRIPAVISNFASHQHLRKWGLTQVIRQAQNHHRECCSSGCQLCPLESRINSRHLRKTQLPMHSDAQEDVGLGAQEAARVALRRVPIREWR